MNPRAAVTPEPPYYCIVFTSRRSACHGADYAEMSARMVELAATIPGFLGLGSARHAAGVGITLPVECVTCAAAR